MDYEKLIEDIRTIIRQELKDPQKHQKFLNIKEAAEYTRFSAGTIRNMVAERKIPYIKRGGKILFVTQDLAEWMVEKKSTVTFKDKYLSIGNNRIRK